MAPSTALLFVLYGTASLLPTCQPLGRGTHRVGVAISFAGAPICASLKSFHQLWPIIHHHHEKMDGSGCQHGTSEGEFEGVLNELRGIHPAEGKR